MRTAYLESRTLHTANQAHQAVDIAHHLLKRQHLGRAVVISHRPLGLMCTVRKQWMRSARALQKERASTINAEKILRLTYSITHMQRMNFTIKTPDVQPLADVFFVSPEELHILPPDCTTLYITAPLPSATLSKLRSQLPADALVVDYCHAADPAFLDLSPKTLLETHVTIKWQHLLNFLQKYNIDITRLTEGKAEQSQALDDALDTLLAHSNDFLHVAANFRQVFERAQPLELPLNLKHQYDAAALLAHRVQALTPQRLDNYLIQTFSDNQVFFLRDSAPESETRALLGELSVYHLGAGRVALANAFKELCAAELPRAEIEYLAATFCSDYFVVDLWSHEPDLPSQVLELAT